MNKSVIKIVVIGLLVNMLTACYDKGKFKDAIEALYERIHGSENFKGDFCLSVGLSKFPYTAELIKEEDTPVEKGDKDELLKILPFFTELGLLTREEVEGQPDVYRYDLTEIGKKYYHFSRRFTDDNSFCYGVLKVDKVTKIQERTFENVRRPYNYEVEVDYDYHVLDVPEWVVTYKDKIKERYQSFRLEGVKYEDTIVYRDRGDGYLERLRGGGGVNSVFRTLASEK